MFGFTTEFTLLVLVASLGLAFFDLARRVVREDGKAKSAIIPLMLKSLMWPIGMPYDATRWAWAKFEAHRAR